MLLVIRKKDENDFMNSQIITLNTRRSLKDHFERSMFTLCSPREERAPTNICRCSFFCVDQPGLEPGTSRL